MQCQKRTFLKRSFTSNCNNIKEQLVCSQNLYHNQISITYGIIVFDTIVFVKLYKGVYILVDIEYDVCY